MCECEEDDERYAADGCAEPTAETVGEIVDDDDDADEDWEIGEFDGAQVCAEESHRECAVIDGEGAGVVGDIAVEDFALGELPGDVELDSEIDEEIGPGLPGPDEHGDEDRGDGGGSGRAPLPEWEGEGLHTDSAAAESAGRGNVALSVVFMRRASVQRAARRMIVPPTMNGPETWM